ncbi:UpxY family transcription antiterminator [Pedobacter alluvionis]|uniref:Transcription antitermination factor NusG n=1 Tax=Pedobacter alluvionis TaxID=475253 RepID=A0A497XVV0_9SPHI|nr:UpxY family transcription antiterminator [Pedobacter alluvionis]RLJ72743.1 transcription antitermination factor NusG [Pedobacter alluvionis]TFB29412.1 UpxY family transcription antiterminator [Pedobacter alluvionis]
MNNFNPGWFVIYTRPRHEKKVEDQLKERKIESFLPVRNEIKTWSDRKKMVKTPLFPSYIFVYIKELAQYYTATGLDGVIYFLKTGKNVSRVNEKVINDIQMLLDFGENISVSNSRFSTGQQLLIQKGPFVGRYCDFIEVNGSTLALVQLNVLQRSLTATLPYEYLTVAD